MLQAVLGAVLLLTSTARFAQTPSAKAAHARARREMCAQTKDPAKCEARVAAIREACTDKQGQELKSCIREQRKKK